MNCLLRPSIQKKSQICLPSRIQLILGLYDCTVMSLLDKVPGDLKLYIGG